MTSAGPRAARPGPRVLVLDEGGNWRGCGTAWHLAEAGHAVTLVTPSFSSRYSSISATRAVVSSMWVPWGIQKSTIICGRVEGDRKSTRLNSSHSQQSRMPSSA